MPINSKAKGNDFERKVAKMLTEWSGSEFHRTPMSGGLRWSNDKRIVSDIVPSQELVDKGWPFSIECKKVEGANWEFSAFIEGTAQTLKEHWEQCKTDSQREDMVPLLIFNKNRKNIYIMITQNTFKKFGRVSKNHMTLEYNGQSLVLLSFQDFLESVSIDKVLSSDFSDCKIPL